MPANRANRGLSDRHRFHQTCTSSSWLTLDPSCWPPRSPHPERFVALSAEHDHHQHARVLGTASLPCYAACIALHPNASHPRTISQPGMSYPNIAPLGDIFFFSPVSRSAAITSLGPFPPGAVWDRWTCGQSPERKGMRALMVAAAANQGSAG